MSSRAEELRRMVFSRTLIVVQRDAGDLKTTPFLSATHCGPSGVTLSAPDLIFVHYFAVETKLQKALNHSKARLVFFHSVSRVNPDQINHIPCPQMNSQVKSVKTKKLNKFIPLHLALSSSSPSAVSSVTAASTVTTAVSVPSGCASLGSDGCFLWQSCNMCVHSSGHNTEAPDRRACTDLILSRPSNLSERC